MLLGSWIARPKNPPTPRNGHCDVVQALLEACIQGVGFRIEGSIVGFRVNNRHEHPHYRSPGRFFLVR